MHQPLEPLTEREEDVLAAVARGLSNAETAASLQIIRSTVKFHLGSLLTKLGARSRAELVIFAYESGRTRRSTGP